MTKPTVTIVSKSGSGWHTDQVAAALAARGITSKVIDFKNDKPFATEMKKLGAVTIWRTSSLSKEIQRSSVANYLDKTYMINEAVFVRPGTSEKFYQQQTIAATAGMSQYAIPTYRVTAKKILEKLNGSGELSLPVIAKPFDGSRGVGIHLIESLDSLKNLEMPLGKYVLQGFIPNDGDWRVIVVGGRAIGAMKRIHQEGAFLNNVSQGAHAVIEDDPATLELLYDLAAKAAAIFRLRFCGVDIIRNEKTGKYHVLEVNTAPQWNDEYGFQSITGINVGDRLAEYIENVLRSQSKENVVDVIDDYYKSSLDTMRSERFHYASRLWLWTHDDWAREQLDSLKEWYIGKDEDAYQRTIDGLLEKSAKPLTVNQNKAYRKKYFEAYRMLPIYNAILFKVVFCDSVYGIDIRPYVAKRIDDKELLGLYNILISDHDAVRVLSTHAVNYFYLLKNYFKDSLTKSSTVLVDPYELLDISREYDHLVERGELTESDALKLRIYILTHAILGESRFYQKTVMTKPFKDLSREIEDVINEHYFDISLDNKCESLVCAKLTGYKPSNKKLILEEAKRSLSWAGSFIVDRDAPPVRHSLRTSEHRNVLFVMASRPRYTAQTSKARKEGGKAVSENKYTIGRLARVVLPDHDSIRLIARIDTGASISSLSVSEVKEAGGKLRFRLLYADDLQYTGEEIEVDDYETVRINNAAAKDQVRYVVPFKIVVDGVASTIRCTLADRTHMLYPVLLGRNFLRNKYRVDVDRQFVDNTIKMKEEI